MALVAATCTNCGGKIDVDENRESGFCPFCGTKYYTEKIINNTFVTNNYTVHVQGVEVENYIKLIENAILQNDYASALKYYQEAVPSAPEDMRLAFLNIKIILLKLQLDLGYSSQPAVNSFWGTTVEQAAPLVSFEESSV